jgi:uncharacterized membrane protein
MKLYKRLEEKIDEFLIKHPMINSMYENTKKFVEDWKKDGFKKAFQKTELYKKL